LIQRAESGRLPQQGDTNCHSPNCRYQYSASRRILCRFGQRMLSLAVQVNGALHCSVNQFAHDDNRICQEDDGELRARELKKIKPQQEKIHICHANAVNAHIALVMQAIEHAADRIDKAHA